MPEENRKLNDVIVELKIQNQKLTEAISDGRQDNLLSNTVDLNKSIKSNTEKQNVILLDLFRSQKNAQKTEAAIKEKEKVETNRQTSILSETNSVFDGVKNSMQDQLSALRELIDFDKNVYEEQKREDRLKSVEKTGVGGIGLLGGAVTASIFFLFKKSVDLFKSTIEDMKSILGRSDGDESFFDKLFGPVIAPLKSLGSFLLKGFKIGGLFYLMFQVFKDIGQNDRFTSLVSSIGSFWNEGLVPFLGSLYDFFFTISEETSPLMKLFGDVRMIVQNLVLDFGILVFDVLGGLLKSVSQLLDGDIFGAIETFNDTFVNGLVTAFNSIVNAIIDSIDAAVSFVLRLFGVNFFEGEGSLFKWFDSKVYAFVDKIKAAWNAFERGWNAVIDFFWGTERNTREDGLGDMVREGGLINMVWSRVTDVIDWVKLYFTDPVEALTQLWNGILGEGGLVDLFFIPVNAFANWISRKLGWSDEDAPDFSIPDIIKEWVDGITEWVRNIFSFLPSAADIKNKLTSFLPDFMRSDSKEESDPAAELRDQVRTLEQQRNEMVRAAEMNMMSTGVMQNVDTSYYDSQIAELNNQIASFRTGSKGFMDFGMGTPAMLHGMEAVVPRNTAAGEFLANNFTDNWEPIMQRISGIESSALQQSMAAPIIVTNAPTIAPVNNNIRGGANVSNQNISGGGMSNASGLGRFAN